MYGTLVEGNAYFATRLHVDSWTNASPDDRTKAMEMATRDIDRLSFEGCKPDGQENEFPREDQDEVPSDINIACYEIALSYLDGVDPSKELSSASVLSEGISSVRATYDRGTVAEHISHGIGSDVAWRYLQPYLKNGGEFRLSRVS